MYRRSCGGVTKLCSQRWVLHNTEIPSASTRESLAAIKNSGASFGAGGKNFSAFGGIVPVTAERVTKAGCPTEKRSNLVLTTGYIYRELVSQRCYFLVASRSEVS